MISQNIIKLPGFTWLDIVDPSKQELEQVAVKYALHHTSIQDCLDPEHLPKYEQIGNLVFIILRSFDEASLSEADTIQELTRKVAVFYKSDLLITVRRKEQPYFLKIKEKWSSLTSIPENLGKLIMADLINGVVASYERPIDEALNNLEKLEMGVFHAQGGKPFEIKEGYFLKRRAFVFKRLFRTLLDLLPKILGSVDTSSPMAQDLREQLDSLYFYADELMESVNSLLNLHISMSSQRTNEASHRTNEVMRVLTIFSVFLLPLNVLTGIYGMNFENMPELKWQYGYPSALMAMVLVSSTVYFWFRRKGWLK